MFRLLYAMSCTVRLSWGEWDTKYEMSKIINEVRKIQSFRNPHIISFACLFKSYSQISKKFSFKNHKMNTMEESMQ